MCQRLRTIMKLGFVILVISLAIARISLAVPEITLLSDDFESGLSQWTGAGGGSTSGATVPDPLNPGNHVLAFNGQSTSGDLFSLLTIPVADLTAIRVRFEYLGKASPGSTPGNLGGFVGFTTNTSDVGNKGPWIAGTDPSAVNGLGFQGIEILDDGFWHSYEVDITDVLKNNSISAFYLMLEDWADAGGIGQGIAGDVYFDNVRVVAAVPETSPRWLTFAIFLPFVVFQAAKRISRI